MSAAATSSPASQMGRLVSLVAVLARKEFQVKYKRAVLGVGWAVAQPALQSLVMIVLFTRIVPIGAGIDHYGLYIIAGVVPWSFASRSFAAGAASAVTNASLMKKVAMPRLVFPLGAIGAVAYANVVPLVILVGMAALTGTLSFAVWTVVPGVALLVALAVGVGVLACAYHVEFRDVTYIVELGALVGFYATPVFWSADRLEGGMRTVVALNPMVGILGLIRHGLLGTPVAGRDVAIATTVVIAVLAAGLLIFRRRSVHFVDLV